MTSDKPDILAFGEYRDYLKALFAWKKLRNARFSYQSCARKLGVTRAHIGHVLAKRRHLDFDRLPQVFKVFAFSPWENEYFTYLFIENLVKDAKLKKHFRSVLGNLRDDKIIPRPVSQEALPFPRSAFGDFDLPLIHNLRALTGFKSDVKWIRSCLASPAPDHVRIKSLLEQLKDVKAPGKGLQVYSANQHAGDSRFQKYVPGLNRILSAMPSIEHHRPAYFQMFFVPFENALRNELAALYVEFEERLLALSRKVKNPDILIYVANQFITVAKTPEHARPKP